MNTTKVTSSLLLASFLFLFGCAGTEEDTYTLRSDMTKEEVRELLQDLAENHAFESLKDLEENLDDMDLDQLEEIAEQAFEHEVHRLADLEHHLADLEHDHMENLEMHLANMHEHLSNIHIDVDIPPIPPIPPIPTPVIDIPDIAVPIEFGFHGHTSAREMKRLFPGITDDEVLKIQAMRSLTRQSSETAVPTLSKIAQKGKSAAQRYTAVTLLSRYLNKDQSIISVLGDVALNDENVNVRKRAVVLLGKSKDSRAISILEDIIKKGGE